MTDILVVGSGGREHALAWKLKQSPKVGTIYIAPGNGGTRLVGENVPIAATDFEQLSTFAAQKGIGLTVVGPDDPLALGIVDHFQSRGLRIWGPSKAAAQIESSKAFAKQLMKEAKIPTAAFETHTEYNKAIAYLRRVGAPIVVKASGLALGKGVYVCKTMEEAEVALKEVMIDKVHKDAGNEVVIEEYLDGVEISVHALCDGVNYRLFPTSQDHKPALDGDMGKNTGGMGTIAPVPWVTSEIMTSVEQHVLRPALETMAARGTPFLGLLYPGIKVTTKGIKVLEFNARFGDPETQVYMRLLKNDLYDLLESCLEGTIGDQHLEWTHGYAANIVLASGGYPDAYERGLPIQGVERAEENNEIVVFHAGTSWTGEGFKTNGGRVLGVCAIGSPLKQALDTAYEAVGKISFQGMQYRKDIGQKSL